MIQVSGSGSDGGVCTTPAAIRCEGARTVAQSRHFRHGVQRVRIRLTHLFRLPVPEAKAGHERSTAKW
jgi:hypothetical protein